MKVNWPIVWIAAVWWLAETIYFGWNATPSCVEELFADGGVLLLLAMAYMRPARQRIEIVVRDKAE
jgi:hypothetical protein